MAECFIPNTTKNVEKLVQQDYYPALRFTGFLFTGKVVSVTEFSGIPARRHYVGWLTS